VGTVEAGGKDPDDGVDDRDKCPSKQRHVHHPSEDRNARRAPRLRAGNFDETNGNIRRLDANKDVSSEAAEPARRPSLRKLRSSLVPGTPSRTRQTDGAHGGKPNRQGSRLERVALKRLMALIGHVGTNITLERRECLP